MFLPLAEGKCCLALFVALPHRTYFVLVADVSSPMVKKAELF